jgi:GNAT superfamily N-acetyltransferase
MPDGTEIGTAFAEALISRGRRIGCRTCDFNVALTDKLEFLLADAGGASPELRCPKGSVVVVEAYVRFEAMCLGKDLAGQQEPKLRFCLNINAISVHKAFRSRGVFRAAITRLEEAAVASDPGLRLPQVLYIQNVFDNDRLAAFLAARAHWREDVSMGQPMRCYYYMPPVVEAAAPFVIP